MDEIIRLGEMMDKYKKLPPSHLNYFEDHKQYLEIEKQLDVEVKKYFEATGKGRLVEGRYFK